MKSESLRPWSSLKTFLVSWVCFACFWTYCDAEVLDIDNTNLQRLLVEGVPIFDIRTEPEWKQTGIVSGSIGLTFFDENGNYNVEDWMGNFVQIAKREDPIILICRSGRRTKIVANYLSEKEGYKTVYNVENGINSWIAVGLPVKPYN